MQKMRKYGRLPDFIIMGAMKCGTTTLWNYLRRHPQILMCVKKDISFFSTWRYEELGEGWYKSMFADVKDYQMCGEVSANYTFWPHKGDTAELIFRTIPRVRLIYIMRNPIERTYSHYAHKMQNRNRMIPFERTIKEDPQLISASLYIKQIEQYLKYFHKDQILCLMLDDLMTDPAKVLALVQRFLGVDELDLLPRNPIVSNAAGDKLVRRQALASLNKLPGFAGLRKITPVSFKRIASDLLCKSPMKARLIRNYKPLPMSNDTRDELIDFFKVPNTRLADFLGRELSHWSH